MSSKGILDDSPALKGNAPVELCWECNECGSQEFTLGISEYDLEKLGCTGCGSNEFHKAAIREGGAPIAKEGA